MRQEYIADRLHRDGYVLLSRWRYNETTIAIGRSMGAVVDISALLSLGGIPTVQTLRPRRKSGASENRYSGTYGLDEFPLHTDLAHWARPPRYLMLRCLEGSQAVATRLLANSTLAPVVGVAVLRRALVRQRHVAPDGVLCALPILFCVAGITGFRWDPLFLVPMNEAADRVRKTMRNHAWRQSDIISLTLMERGDTLLLDNWRFLHGRSRVSEGATSRRLERLYLSEIYR